MLSDLFYVNNEDKREASFFFKEFVANILIIKRKYLKNLVLGYESKISRVLP